MQAHVYNQQQSSTRDSRYYDSPLYSNIPLYVRDDSITLNNKNSC